MGAPHFWERLITPVLKLSRDITQDIAADWIEIPVASKEPDNAFFLLKGLDQAVEQNAIEAAILKPDAILVMLVERVHWMTPSGLRKPKG